ncbi:MAG: hypothetical protein QNJ97_11735 [Myxococcota bacterium]|nr:hypothetical protein [Myxococcota bacterium]
MSKRILLAGMFGLLAALFCSGIARAQSDDQVEAKYVGVSGGAIAGAEVVIAAQALLGVDKLWAYLTFPVLGAAGGGVGGYFLEQESAPGAVALLASSMALIIPTAILASSAMAYDPASEGAIGGDQEGGAVFSFEAPPTGNVEEGTTTEVESRPQGAPATSIPPPAAGGGPPEQPQAEPASPATSDPAAAPESPPESDVPAAPEQGAEASETSKNSQRIQQHRNAQLAKLRRATAGSLLYVDRDGTPAISMPVVGIRPTGMTLDEMQRGMTRGIEVMVSLLKIELP